jgi:hypothetical protein
MKRETIPRKRTFHTVLMAIEVLEMAVFLLPALYLAAVLLQMEPFIPMLLVSLLLPGDVCRLLMEKARRFWQYLLGWIAAAGISVVIFSSAGGFIYAAASSLICVIMLVQRLFPSLQDTIQPGWVRLGIVAALFCAASAVSPSAAEVALYSAMTYLMLKFLWDALSSTDTYIRDMEEVSYLPERQIRAMGGGISLLYAVLVGFVMVGFSFLPLQGVFEWLGQMLLAALRWFFSLFSGDEENVIEPEEEVLPPENSGFPLEGGSSSWLADLLQQICIILGFVIVGVGILAAIVYIVYKLYKNFYEIPEGRTEEKEFILPFLREERLSHGSKKATARWGRDPVSRIRRLYRKKIQKGMPKKAVPSQSATPSEQMEAAGLNQKPQSEDFHNLYEKARYGNGVTVEDAEQMRSISSKL